MRENGRDPIRLSQLPASEVVMGYRNGNWQVRLVCPDCGTWQGRKQRVLHPHSLADGSKCPASQTPIIRDTNPIAVHERYLELAADASLRRRPTGKPAHNDPREKATTPPVRTSAPDQPSLRAGQAPERRDRHTVSVTQ